MLVELIVQQCSSIDTLQTQPCLVCCVVRCMIEDVGAAVAWSDEVLVHAEAWRAGWALLIPIAMATPALE